MMYKIKTTHLGDKVITEVFTADGILIYRTESPASPAIIYGGSFAHESPSQRKEKAQRIVDEAIANAGGLKRLEASMSEIVDKVLAGDAATEKMAREIMERNTPAFGAQTPPRDDLVAIRFLYRARQREQVGVDSKIPHLSAEDAALASAEWSRQLREKVAASEKKREVQVFCDIQDIE